MKNWYLRALTVAFALVFPTLALAGEKAVTLDIEGRRAVVRTYADSPADVAERTGHSDRLAASLRPELKPGDVVVLRRPRPVSLIVDGVSSDAVVHATTVGEAVDELGVGNGVGDAVYPPPSTPVVDGMPIIVRNGIHVTVVVDGARRDVVGAADTVEELLKNAGITLGDFDWTKPSRSSEPEGGDEIKVVRVGHRTQTERVEIAPETVTKKDPTLTKGTKKVVADGSAGLREVTYRVVVENGRVTSRKVVSSRTIREPVDRVVKVGTKPSFTGGAGSDTGIASWFNADGFIAAHRTLPFGTVVRVTNLNTGKTINVTIRDRGPFIDGRIIDLSDDAFAALAPLGSGTFRAKIEW